MVDLPAGLRERLSDRVLDYAGIAFTPDGPLPVDTGGAAAIAFDSSYRGLSVLSLGGPLEGAVLLGIHGQRPVWSTASGLTIFRCGRHPTIQCAIVAADDGRIGCSWTSEFTPLFDSVEHFLENAAAWGRVQGWRFVAVGDVPVESAVRGIGALDADVAASGALAKWWMGDDFVVVAQPYLNPSRDGRSQVSVLARTLSSMEEARRRIAGGAVPDVAYKTATVWGAVPTLPQTV